MSNVEKHRFVILGQGRCGSNLLKFSLKQNRAISVIGELFNKNVYDDVFEVDGAERARRYYSAELEKSSVVSAGFKLFAHQATRKPAKSVWRYLLKERVKVIHLERRNKVDRLISLEVASSTGAFLKRSENEAYKIHQIEHPVSWWEEKIERDYEVEGQLANRFSDNPYLHVYYEDMVESWAKETSRIQEFLEVPVQSIDKAIDKQEIKTKSERLKNYSEVVRAFDNTKYKWMF